VIAQILVNGIMLGAVYALLSIGFSLIYGSARIINLMHTALFMLAAYLILTFFTILHINIWLAVPIALVLTVAIGVLLYKVFVERIREHENAVFLITIALALVIQQVILLVYGSLFKGVEAFIPGFMEVFGVRVANQNLLTLGCVLVCVVGMVLFLYKTKPGLALRVTAQDREISNLIGINVNGACTLAVGIGIFFAAIAGIMVSPMNILEPRMWSHPLTIVLAVVILGGIGSIKGSIIGALILGLVESAVVNLLPMGSFVKGAIALAVMVAVLLIRPEGLFGVAFEEERL